MSITLPKQLTLRSSLIIFLGAFIFRIFVFYLFIDPFYRYNQPDTKDYHVCALSIAQGKGMSYPNSTKPIFWRTPGYPFLLSFFYKYFGFFDIRPLEKHKNAHRAFLIFQIFLCSFIPLLIFILAQMMTPYPLAWWASALISIFHIGFVLTSTYLMTDGISTLLFLIFLYLLYSLILNKTNETTITKRIFFVMSAALVLGAFTWMRPMGINIAILSSLLLLFSTQNWQKRILQSLLFLLIFFGSVSPWYIRNYQLTGRFFFCPIYGPYTLTFLVPKIAQRLKGGDLVTHINKFLREARIASEKVEKEKMQTNSSYVSCKELLCAELATPWIIAHPFYFALDWTIEMFKTTCDLYVGHLVNFVRNDYYKEPPVEFLSQKLKDFLYKEKLPISIRIIAWVELFFHIFILLGLIGGCIKFILQPLWRKITSAEGQKRRLVWFISIMMIGLIIGMTGGFGYARLRLPVEALMIILAFDFWIKRKSKNCTIGFLQETKV